ncbi:hypothetical protein CF086_17120 [Clostridium botulinum]|nr:hypothetical protein [Clostridium botulinum]MBN3352018.1 hypothetical protein [Clostridium botulinum]
MLKLYKDVKEEYKNESVTINFVGKTENGELRILFQKEIINKDTELKEYAKKVVNTNTEDIIKNIYSSFKMLNDKRKYNNEQISICDKEQDILLHKIEHFKNELGDELKISIFNKIQEIRIQRRKFKEDLDKCGKTNGKLCNYINQKNGGLTTEKFENLLEQILQSIINGNNKQYEFLTDEKVEEFKIMKKVRYKDFKDRIRLTKELQKEYDKVYYDNSKMEITCYNKAKVC